MSAERVTDPSNAVWVAYRELEDRLREQLKKRKDDALEAALERLEWCLQEVTAQAEFQTFAVLWEHALHYKTAKEDPKRYAERHSEITHKGLCNPWEHYEDSLPYTAIIRDVQRDYFDLEEIGIEPLDSARRLMQELCPSEEEQRGPVRGAADAN